MEPAAARAAPAVPSTESVDVAAAANLCGCDEKRKSPPSALKSRSSGVHSMLKGRRSSIRWHPNVARRLLAEQPLFPSSNVIYILHYLFFKRNVITNHHYLTWRLYRTTIIPILGERDQSDNRVEGASTRAIGSVSSTLSLELFLSYFTVVLVFWSFGYFRLAILGFATPNAPTFLPRLPPPPPAPVSRIAGPMPSPSYFVRTYEPHSAPAASEIL